MPARPPDGDRHGPWLTGGVLMPLFKGKTDEEKALAAAAEVKAEAARAEEAAAQAVQERERQFAASPPGQAKAARAATAATFSEGRLSPVAKHAKAGLLRADVERWSLERWRPGDPTWLTTTEAAEVLGVTRTRMSRSPGADSCRTSGPRTGGGCPPGAGRGGGAGQTGAVSRPAGRMKGQGCVRCTCLRLERQRNDQRGWGLCCTASRPVT